MYELITEFIRGMSSGEKQFSLFMLLVAIGGMGWSVLYFILCLCNKVPKDKINP